MLRRRLRSIRNEAGVAEPILAYSHLLTHLRLVIVSRVKTSVVVLAVRHQASVYLREANVLFVLGDLCFALMTGVPRERLAGAQFSVVNSVASQRPSRNRLRR